MNTQGFNAIAVGTAIATTAVIAPHQESEAAEIYATVDFSYAEGAVPFMFQDINSNPITADLTIYDLDPNAPYNTSFPLGDGMGNIVGTQHIYDTYQNGFVPYIDLYFNSEEEGDSLTFSGDQANVIDYFNTFGATQVGDEVSVGGSIDSFIPDGSGIEPDYIHASWYNTFPTDPGRTSDPSIVSNPLPTIQEFAKADDNHPDSFNSNQITIDFKDEFGNMAGTIYGFAYTTEANGFNIITPTLLGDYNDNGTVDAADYTVWRDTFGQNSDLRADGDIDGDIDGNDFLIWQQNFGNTANNNAQTTNAPEPGSGVLLILAGAGFAALRPRRESGLTSDIPSPMTPELEKHREYMRQKYELPGRSLDL